MDDTPDRLPSQTVFLPLSGSDGGRPAEGLTMAAIRDNITFKFLLHFANKLTW